MSNELKRIGSRAVAAFVALGLGTGLTITTLLTPAVAHAYTALGGQVQSRAIYMSTATPSATAVQYQITFKPTLTTSLKGIIVDFCAGSPIIGDSTCAKPASNFDVGGATPTFTTSATTAGTNSPVTSTGLPGTWTAAGLNNATGYRTLKLTAAGGSGALTTSTLYNITLTNVTNPSTTGTFYARILTYNLDTGDIGSYAPGTEGATNLVDYGGIALSTVSNITITAKVQESLTFCASAADLSSSLTCTSATTPTLTLGHGSPAPGVLDNTAVDRTTAYTQASTNATSGLAIRMHATNSCANAGLSANGGSTCNINGMPTTSGIPAQVLTAGTTAFGLYVANSTTNGTGTSSGTITPSTNYRDAAHTNEGTGDLYYGMNQTANSGVTSTYGDLIASSAGPVSTICNHLVFGATAGLTVPAGIYTGQESLIATGTF